MWTVRHYDRPAHLEGRKTPQVERREASAFRKTRAASHKRGHKVRLPALRSLGFITGVLRDDGAPRALNNRGDQACLP